MTSPSKPAADYSAIISKLDAVVREEMRAWNIGGVAMALVDDQHIVYETGFGEAQGDSIFRVGSISKLFNAISVMQQVEAGKLDLDAPPPADLPPINPFPDAPAVTLRQLLCHRSGLQREPSVGGYLDESQPGLAATVASVRSCVLATRPGEKTRYSNLGPSIAGAMVERVSGQSFEDYQRDHVLGPLGMTSSSWTLARTPGDRLVTSHLRVADGRGGFTRRITPVFDLGTIPAGNLFSTAGDLGRFAIALLADGGGLIKPQTLREMWRPQLTDEKIGYGLAFVVGKFREHQTIGHGGAVFGCSSTLLVLPEAKIAVVVLGNEDEANGRIRRMGNLALSLMLEAKFGETPEPRKNFPIPADLAEFAGDYESQSYWAKLEIDEGRLIGNISGQPAKFTPTGELAFALDTRLEDATPAIFERDAAGAISGFKFGLQQFTRVPANPPPLPPEWRAYLGVYGPELIPIVISERHGHLYAMTENMVDYRLTPINRNVCGLPLGMYPDEQVVFLTGETGHPNWINFASMILPRR